MMIEGIGGVTACNCLCSLDSLERQHGIAPLFETLEATSTCPLPQNSSISLCSRAILEDLASRQHNISMTSLVTTDKGWLDPP
jgi:hypothetical protein